MANNHNDYEELASLLYPSIEASGNVYYGQTRKLAIDELFNINDGGFESSIKTIRRQTDSNEDGFEYISYFCWKFGPLNGRIRIVPCDNDKFIFTFANFPEIERIYNLDDTYITNDSTDPIVGTLFVRYKLLFKDNTINNVLNSGTFDSYEKCASKLKDRTAEATKTPASLKKLVGDIRYRFAYPEIEKTLKLTGANKAILLKTLHAVIGTLDPTLQDVRISKDLKDTFIIRRGGTEIIIQEGRLLNREVLSSGTADGIDVAMFLAAIIARESTFYYCDEHFSYIQSDIEKRIFGIMLDRLGNNEQLIFTTHNTDMLDLNLPKHSYIFLRKQQEDGIYNVSAISASEVLKRNTDSIRNAVENDIFASLPQDSLLDELEMGWANEQ